jgi:hypothetical protein
MEQELHTVHYLLGHDNVLRAKHELRLPIARLVGRRAAGDNE